MNKAIISTSSLQPNYDDSHQYYEAWLKERAAQKAASLQSKKSTGWLSRITEAASSRVAATTQKVADGMPTLRENPLNAFRQPAFRRVVFSSVLAAFSITTVGSAMAPGKNAHAAVPKDNAAVSFTAAASEIGLPSGINITAAIPDVKFAPAASGFSGLPTGQQSAEVTAQLPINAEPPAPDAAIKLARAAPNIPTDISYARGQLNKYIKLAAVDPDLKKTGVCGDIFAAPYRAALHDGETVKIALDTVKSSGAPNEMLEKLANASIGNSSLGVSPDITEIAQKDAERLCQLRIDPPPASQTPSIGVELEQYKIVKTIVRGFFQNQGNFYKVVPTGYVQAQLSKQSPKSHLLLETKGSVRGAESPFLHAGVESSELSILSAKAIQAVQQEEAAKVASGEPVVAHDSSSDKVPTATKKAPPFHKQFAKAPHKAARLG